LRTPLANGEDLIVIGKRHQVILYKPALGLIIMPILALTVRALNMHKIMTIAGTTIFLGLAALSLIIFISRFIDMRYSIWALTDRRLIREWGVLSRNFDETPLSRVTNISLKQSYSGRILNYGWVGVQTAAEEGFDGFSELADPQGFVDAMNDARRNMEQGGRDLRKCPFCAEMVKKEAIVCRYCGRDLS
jgi:uncharacterized membrane protein YdbT with pleckstrin-like domain